MKAKKHQVAKAAECYKVLKERGVVYLAAPPRTGKTLTAILVAEQSKAKSILVFTKKAAISGWMKFSMFMNKDYHITNYEQASKITKKYDLIIVDEAHNLGCIGKANKRVKEIRALAYDKPVILLSGTPHAETKASLYHQFYITKYSPFNSYVNFYRFFEKYGIPDSKFIVGRVITIYKKTKQDLDHFIKPYFVVMTKEDAEMVEESTDQLHYVKLNEETKEKYNTLLKDSVYKDIVCETDMSLRMTLHQLETSVEKLAYIKENFSKNIAIMSHFIAEQKFLEYSLPYATVLSSNKFKEGVDLSMYDDFVIVSADYSGSGFIQRRERNVNMNVKKKTITHHILVKDAISEQVYAATSQKRDFNNEIFERKILC